MKNLIYVFIVSLAMVSCQNELIDDVDLAEDSVLDPFKAEARSIEETDSTIYPLVEKNFVSQVSSV